MTPADEHSTAGAAPGAVGPALGAVEPVLGAVEVERYARHLGLDEVGLEGQERLKRGAVLCVGAGGLGAPALLYLAAAGVGRLGVCDFDVVERSNLQRQILYGERAVGRPKAACARERLIDLNPHVEVVVHEERLTRENALAILARYDVVIDGTDAFPTRYLLSDACALLGKPYIYGAIVRFEGQVSVFHYRGGPGYRDLFPEPPPAGVVPTCAEGGVLGVLPGVIGAIQATEALKILLERGEVLSGRLLIYDALRMRFRELKVVGRADAHPAGPLTEVAAPACERRAAASGSAPSSAPSSPHPEETAMRPGEPYPTATPTSPATPTATPSPAPLRGAGARGDAGLPQPRPSPYTPLGVREVEARLAAGWAPFVLDVRAPQEAAVATLPFTDRLQPHVRVLDIAHELPRDRDLLVYCKAGVRSRYACEVLASRGFTRLFNMEGGIGAWAREVDRSVGLY